MIKYIPNIKEAEEYLISLSDKERDRAVLVEPSERGSKLIVSIFKTGKSESVAPFLLDTHLANLVDVNQIIFVGNPPPRCLIPTFEDKEDTRQALKHASKIMELVAYDQNRSQIDYELECILTIVRMLEFDSNLITDLLFESQDEVRDLEDHLAGG